jgi:hypothetical protein
MRVLTLLAAMAMLRAIRGADDDRFVDGEHGSGDDQFSVSDARWRV